MDKSNFIFPKDFPAKRVHEFCHKKVGSSFNRFYLGRIRTKLPASSRNQLQLARAADLHILPYPLTSPFADNVFPHFRISLNRSYLSNNVSALNFAARGNIFHTSKLCESDYRANF